MQSRQKWLTCNTYIINFNRDASDSKYASIIPKKIEDDPITNLEVLEDDQEFEPNRLTYREEEEKTK